MSVAAIAEPVNGHVLRCQRQTTLVVTVCWKNDCRAGLTTTGGCRYLAWANEQ